MSLQKRKRQLVIDDNDLKPTWKKQNNDTNLINEVLSNDICPENRVLALNELNKKMTVQNVDLRAEALKRGLLSKMYEMLKNEKNCQLLSECLRMVYYLWTGSDRKETISVYTLTKNAFTSQDDLNLKCRALKIMSKIVLNNDDSPHFTYKEYYVIVSNFLRMHFNALSFRDKQVLISIIQPLLLNPRCRITYSSILFNALHDKLNELVSAYKLVASTVLTEREQSVNSNEILNHKKMISQVLRILLKFLGPLRNNNFRGNKLFSCYGRELFCPKSTHKLFDTQTLLQVDDVKTMTYVEALVGSIDVSEINSLPATTYLTEKMNALVYREDFSSDAFKTYYNIYLSYLCNPSLRYNIRKQGGLDCLLPILRHVQQPQLNAVSFILMLYIGFTSTDKLAAEFNKQLTNLVEFQWYYFLVLLDHTNTLVLHGQLASSELFLVLCVLVEHRVDTRTMNDDKHWQKTANNKSPFLLMDVLHNVVVMLPPTNTCFGNSVAVRLVHKLVAVVQETGELLSEDIIDKIFHIIPDFVMKLYGLQAYIDFEFFSKIHDLIHEPNRNELKKMHFIDRLCTVFTKRLNQNEALKSLLTTAVRSPDHIQRLKMIVQLAYFIPFDLHLRNMYFGRLRCTEYLVEKLKDTTFYVSCATALHFLAKRINIRNPKHLLSASKTSLEETLWTQEKIQQLVDASVSGEKDLVTFRCSDGSLTCSRKKMSGVSEYFRALLEGGFRESNQVVIYINYTNIHTFRYFFALMLRKDDKIWRSQEFPLLSDMKTMLNVFELCELYMVDDDIVLQGVDAIIKYCLNMDNVVDIYQWSIECDSNHLRVETVAFALVSSCVKLSEIIYQCSIAGVLDNFMNDVQRMILEHVSKVNHQPIT